MFVRVLHENKASIHHYRSVHIKFTVGDLAMASHITAHITYIHMPDITTSQKIFHKENIPIHHRLEEVWPFPKHVSSHTEWYPDQKKT